MRKAAKVLALLAVLGAVAFWWFKPTYIVLDIPVPRSPGGVAFWSEQQYSEQVYSDSRGVLYVHRRVGTAYVEWNWKTLDEAYAFFDKALSERGWASGPRGIEDSTVPESRLLGPENFKSYLRADEKQQSEARVHVAIWPIRSDTVKGFHVVMVTEQPSLLRQLQRAMD